MEEFLASAGTFRPGSVGGVAATSLSRVKAESSTRAPPDCFARECKNFGVRHRSFSYLAPLLARGDSAVGGINKSEDLAFAFLFVAKA